MAEMFPNRLPGYIQNDSKRAAERKVYEALEQSLDEKFHVFYSVAWLTRRRSGGAMDGEVDFVVGHPEHGILLIEVKGGRIGRDGRTGVWASMDRQGNAHKIKNPVEQVKNAKYALMDKLKEHPYWKNRWIEFGHAVVLPDCETPGSPLAPEAPFDIVSFSADMERLAEKIADIFQYWRRSQEREFRLGADGLKLLTQMLAPTFELRMPLGTVLAEEDRQILQLTEQQFKVLDLLSRQCRVAISGGAGTGKTVLALEKAKRLASEGLRVLLTCFNRALADYLKASVEEVKNLQVCNFHQLCYQMAKTADVTLPSSGGADREFFDRTMPESLLQSLDKTDTRYDAIVVDEGQDFLESWWDPLQLCLTDPGSGILYIFYDDNQRIYRKVSSFPGDLVEIPLFENLRNTKKIHSLASRFYHGAAVTAKGPEGRDVEVVQLRSPDVVSRETGRLLHRLIREEEIPPADIAILCGKSVARGAFGQSWKVGAFEVTSSQDVEPKKVLLQSIRAFKGLERRVILLADIDGLSADDADSLVYVGVTRARTHLAVLAEKATVDRLGLAAAS